MTEAAASVASMVDTPLVLHTCGIYYILCTLTGFHLRFLSRGANATIPELRGGEDYSIFFHP